MRWCWLSVIPRLGNVSASMGRSRRRAGIGEMKRDEGQKKKNC